MDDNDRRRRVVLLRERHRRHGLPSAPKRLWFLRRLRSRAELLPVELLQVELPPVELLQEPLPPPEVLQEPLQQVLQLRCTELLRSRAELLCSRTELRRSGCSDLCCSRRFVLQLVCVNRVRVMVSPETITRFLGVQPALCGFI